MYSIENVVTNIVIILYGARWVTRLSVVITSQGIKMSNCYAGHLKLIQYYMPTILQLKKKN